MRLLYLGDDPPGDARPDVLVGRPKAVVLARARWPWVPALVQAPPQAGRAVLAGFQLWADEYLDPLPPAPEIDLRAAAALGRLRQLREVLALQSRCRPTKSPPGIRGTLDAVGLGPLADYLRETAQSGILTLVREADDRSGQVFFRAGAPVRASAGAARNGEGLVEMMGWGEGAFEFNVREVALEDRIGPGLGGLLRRAAERLTR